MRGHRSGGGDGKEEKILYQAPVRPGPVEMEAHNPDLFTEILPPGSAESTGAAGPGRPGDIDLPAIPMPEYRLVSQDPGQVKVPLALVKHLRIGAAHSAVQEIIILLFDFGVIPCSMIFQVLKPSKFQLHDPAPSG
jgi:hypothetical protein